MRTFASAAHLNSLKGCKCGTYPLGWHNHPPDAMVIPNSSALTAPGTTSTLNLQVQSVDDLARLARVFAASGLFGRAGSQETQIAECAIRLMAGMRGFSRFVPFYPKSGTREATLADFIGLDTCLEILNVLQQGLGDPKYRPCPLLRKHVEAGYLGKKTGRGFYTYEKA